MQNYIIRKYGDYRSVWVSKEEVQRVSGFSDEYIRKVKHKFKLSVAEWQKNSLVYPVTGASYRWGVINDRVWFDLEFIPKKICKKLRSRFEVLEIINNPKITEEVYPTIKSKILDKIQAMQDNVHVDYYQYQSPTKNFSRSEAEVMSRRYASVKMLYWSIEGSNYVQLGVAKKDDMLDVFCRVMTEEGIMKMSNRRSLRRKLEDFPVTSSMEKQLEWVISGNYNNTNSRVVMLEMLVDMETGEQMRYDVHLTLMLAMYMNISHSNKLRKFQSWQKYKTRLEHYGIDAEPVSLSTFKRYTNCFYFRSMSSLERDGKKYFNDKFNPYISAYKLKYAGSLWAGDGSGSKLGYLDASGKVYTLMCCYVFDVMSYKIMGYSIGSEDSEKVMDAMKMAYEMSDGKMAKEFVSDNGSAWSRDAVQSKLQKCFNKVRRIGVGNSQANPAERIIFMISEEMRDQFNWLHSGFASSFKNVENRANGDYVNKKKLPSKEEAWTQLEMMIERWNNQEGMDGKTPNQRYSENEREDMQKLDVKNYRFAMGMENEVDISYMRGIVRVMWGGRTYEYDIPNYAHNLEKLSVDTGMKGSMNVIVKHDGQEADLYSRDGKYILTCKKLVKTHKSRSESTAETIEAKKHLDKKKKDFMNGALQMVEDVQKGMDVIGGKKNEVNYESMCSSKRKEDFREVEEKLINARFGVMSAEEKAFESLY